MSKFLWRNFQQILRFLICSNLEKTPKLDWRCKAQKRAFKNSILVRRDSGAVKRNIVSFNSTHSNKFVICEIIFIRQNTEWPRSRSNARIPLYRKHFAIKNRNRYILLYLLIKLKIHWAISYKTSCCCLHLHSRNLVLADNLAHSYFKTSYYFVFQDTLCKRLSLKLVWLRAA